MRFLSILAMSVVITSVLFRPADPVRAESEGAASGNDRVNPVSPPATEGRFRFLQPVPGCADLDVIPPGQHRPAFRLLLPKNIVGAEDKIIAQDLHAVAGQWDHRDDYSRGEFISPDKRLKIYVLLRPRGRELEVTLDVVNLSDAAFTNAGAEIGMDFGRFSDKPGWSNRDIIPAEVPLTRSAQAGHWYEHIAPRQVKALGPKGWVGTHPHSGPPATDGGSDTNRRFSATEDYRAHAVHSSDGQRLYYMAWDAPCRLRTPDREDAGLNLQALLERPLGGGEYVGLRGIIGVLEGDWDLLAEHVGRFLRHWTLEDCPPLIEREGEWIELFNGRDLTGWLSMGPSAATTWYAAGKVEAVIDEDERGRLVAAPGEGVLINGPDGRTFNLVSEWLSADCEVHAEFMVARRSNSGIFFHGKYEVQILDSYGKPEVTASDCGGIYPRWVYEREVDGRAPRVNASKPPGEWQSYEVIFRAPRFDEQGNKIANARFVKVVHNGVVIHENVELAGPTRTVFRGPERPCAPLVLQGDHGPVAFRNIRARRLNLD